MRTLRLLEITHAREQLTVAYAVDELRFHTSIWYQDLDLDELAARHGELFERLAFHIALFHLNTACSLRPDVLELGPWARFATPELARLFGTIFRRVWAQWRWEHELPDYHGPRFEGTAPPPALTLVPDGPLLAFSGGGKDSLVALRLLERGGLPFATLGYSHSIYGPAAPQHALIERVGERSARVRAERVSVYDDLLDAPAARSFGVRSLLAAETPASLFLALPLVLARGYRGLVLAHERSANSANLVWEGEAVNHQWGKGWEAEQLLDGYLGRLLAGVRYFSVLAPVHDEVVFELLSRDAALAGLTHSCNVRKPWCGRCAKCVYVWLQMMAHLPPSDVRAWFREAGSADLSELPGNERWLRELLGLTEHSPFECVGSPDEARLALATVRARGLVFPTLERLAAEVGPVEISALAGPLCTVGEHGMPEDVARAVIPQLEDAAASARIRADSLALGSAPR